MPSTFTAKASRGLGTSLTTVGSYVVAASTNAIIIGLSIANVYTDAITVSVQVNDGTNNTYLIKGALIPMGGTLVVVGGDQKVVLPTGYSVKVISTVAASMDVYMSVLENT